MRPQPGYRDIFFRSLMAQRPQSVLDVGAGRGALLARVAEAGVTAAGVEYDAGLAQQALASGLAMQAGSADALPYEDGSFDWVVSEFSLHHFPNAERSLAEMLRVAGKGVMILDQWYDDTVPSQRTARAFDEFFKGLDRAGGMVHEASFTAVQLHTLARKLAPSAVVRVQTMLELLPYPLEAMREGAAEYRQRGLMDAGAERAFAALEAQAAADGLSDDGAILLSIVKA